MQNKGMKQSYMLQTIQAAALLLILAVACGMAMYFVGVR